MAAKTVLAFGYHDQQAQRHWTMTKRLKEKGDEIIECHTTKSGLLPKYADLMSKYRKHRKKINTVLVTFPGHYLMPLAWVLTRFPRKKVTFDAFISLHDTLVDDRKKYARWNPFAWFLFCVDFITCHLADEVLIDTEAHRKFFIKTFKINPKKIHVVYLGTREDLFFPEDTEKNPNRTEVLFYGTYIPLQGIEYIIGAAAILAPIEPNIHFTFIGSGQTYPQMKRLVNAKQLKNITFKNKVPMKELPNIIRKANVSLGIFGTSGKASRVIPHKVYDSVACGVPVVTANTPAIHEKFTDGKEVYLCTAGDPQSIAAKIQEIANRR